MKRILGLMLAPILLWSSLAWGVSKQYINPETSITFGDSSATFLIDFSATAAGTGKYSAIADKGAGARAAQYVWSCTFSLTGTNVVGSYLELYVAWSTDGTTLDGGLGTTKAALASADKRRNLKRIGTVVVDQTTTNTNMTGSGQAFLPTRYFTLAMYNATGLPLQTSTTLHKCTFTPSPFEMQ